jgi:hypothetical protein
MNRTTEILCIITGGVTAFAKNGWIFQGLESLINGAIGALGALILSEGIKYIKTKIKK